MPLVVVLPDGLRWRLIVRAEIPKRISMCSSRSGSPRSKRATASSKGVIFLGAVSAAVRSASARTAGSAAES